MTPCPRYPWFPLLLPEKPRQHGESHEKKFGSCSISTPLCCCYTVVCSRFVAKDNSKNVNVQVIQIIWRDLQTELAVMNSAICMEASDDQTKW